MKNKMDMITNLRSLQSRGGDRQEPSTCINGGKCYNDERE